MKLNFKYEKGRDDHSGIYKIKTSEVIKCEGKLRPWKSEIGGDF